MSNDLMMGVAMLVFMYLMGLLTGQSLASSWRDAKIIQRDKKILSASHPDQIVRDPKLTPVMDFMTQFQERFATLLTAAQRTSVRGYALWWVVEAQRDVLDRRVISIQQIRDQLAAKCKKGDLLHYAEVDKLLGYMQTATEETQEALARAQQNLEGDPESRIPQKTGR